MIRQLMKSFYDNNPIRDVINGNGNTNQSRKYGELPSYGSIPGLLFLSRMGIVCDPSQAPLRHGSNSTGSFYLPFEVPRLHAH